MRHLAASLFWLCCGVNASTPQAARDTDQPLHFEADAIEGVVGDFTRATGRAKIKQGSLTLRADDLTHTQVDNTAKAVGHVQITRNGNRYQGDQLRLALDTMEGEFIRPRYWFSQVKAGGHAERIDFLGDNRVKATRATYTSCTPENTSPDSTEEPDWELVTSQIHMDFQTNEGRAENAVVWFKGVPILAAPVLSFPLNDQRKSGWLPPSFNYDNRSGFEFSIPYYWNIAPNYDATLTPTYAAKRGTGLDSEFRLLNTFGSGSARLVGLPNDQLRQTDRGMFDLRYAGQWAGQGLDTTDYTLRWRRVSDDNYWKDFPRALPSAYPRLNESHANFEHQLNVRNWGLGTRQTHFYGGIQAWQTLRDLSSDASSQTEVIAPYGRQQLGWVSQGTSDMGTLWSTQLEANRFTHRDTSRTTGQRLHAIASVAHDIGHPGSLSVTPKLSINTARYEFDPTQAGGKPSASRTVPTFSVDGSAIFERAIRVFSQDFTQTLEPRLRYTRTPYVDQSDIPLFDSAGRDFNQYALYNDNAFTGNDRISDANQITLGLTSRILVPATGTEAMRFGLVQRYLLSDQRLNPDGEAPITQKLSDMLLLGSSTIVPNWSLNGQIRLSAETQRTQRVLMGATYNPGPYRTVNLNYSYTRESNEQVNLGVQWPIAGKADDLTRLFKDSLAASSGTSPSAPCGGTWYGVGHVSYSMRDKRLANALYGLEYDAGCWIGRIVVEQLSLGKETASSRIMFQLELVGLSRLGSSPLGALRDNIPGYRLLRDDNARSHSPDPSTTLSDD